MPFDIIDRNIVEMNCDAIVNSANHLVAVGSGVDYQIYQKAGEQLFKAREKIGVIDYGQAVITDGYNLAAKKIIHTVSPVYDGTNSCKELLENCYKNSLRLAYQNNCKSIALPLLASGNNGFPKDIALNIANKAINEFMENCDEINIYLIVYSKKDISEGLANEQSINSFINRNLVHNRDEQIKNFFFSAPNVEKENSYVSCDSYCGIVKHESFSESLLRLIDERDLKDSQVYNKANVSRQTFSKIRCNKNYNPDKNTALALAIALKLDLNDTQQLIAKAGYVLSDSIVADLIVKYFITQKNYDIIKINETLYAYSCKLLGSKMI